MKALSAIHLSDVVNVYSGAEGNLWEFVMGRQIHIGGLKSSMALAECAGIAAGTRGVDLCCCNGAGMRFLRRFRQVSGMTGVDATAEVISRGRAYGIEEGMTDGIEFIHGDVCRTGLASQAFDFVWGEDAWCYVEDKPALIAEAVRIVRDGGTIAFTDWVVGPTGLSDAEAARFQAFMKFPSLLSIDEYRDLLASAGCSVRTAEDTGIFAPHVDLYLNMLNMQLTSDALRIIGFDMERMQAMGAEMAFMQELAHAGKIAQGRFVAVN